MERILIAFWAEDFLRDLLEVDMHLLPHDEDVYVQVRYSKNDIT